MVDFGVCDCGDSLIPVWFTEEETKVSEYVFVGRVLTLYVRIV